MRPVWCRAFLQSPPRIDELNIHEWRRTHIREALLVKNVQTVYGKNGAKKDAEEAWEERGTMRFAQGRHFNNLFRYMHFSSGLFSQFSKVIIDDFTCKLFTHNNMYGI